MKNNSTNNLNKLFGLSIGTCLLFALIIWLITPALKHYPHLPDQGASWYYWKLPEGTFLTRLTAWGGYILHQVTVWILIYKGQKNKTLNTYSRNLMMLLVNLGFMFLHLAQTFFFYDGLAQDVSVWSSQQSVVGMLVLVLILLAPVRGMFFGKKWAVKKEVMSFVKKYHGYYISWALVYTFWYHPMDGDPRLVFGFLYMFFLFIQMSMGGNRIHRNINWVTFLEVFVAFHGVTVALISGQEAWPMFLFGFLMLFVVTQMFGLKWPPILRIITTLVYGAGIGIVYFYRGYDKIYELSFIPLTLYGLAILIIFLVRAGLGIKNKVQPTRNP